MRTLDELRALIGVPESTLAASTAAELPAWSPAPPWRSRAEVVLWAHRATAEAASAVPEPQRSQPSLPLTVAAAVRYRSSPVGPYSEVLASPLVLGRLPALSIPFIAVDSLASVHGGRSHWSLPKAAASFRWEQADARGAEVDVTVAGDGWDVGVDALPVGLPLPFAAALPCRQLQPDGSVKLFTVAFAGLIRPAAVRVATAGPTLPQWLPSGVHLGAVLSRCLVRVGPLR